MSSLWTPDGERPVPRQAPEPPSGAADDPPDSALAGGDGGFSDAGVSEEDARAIQEELAEARRRLADAPVEVLVINHAMGLYELAAIHLSGEPPRLGDAALAIDAFACLVEGLGDRLGPDVATLRDALSQIRLAFVQIKGAAG